MQEEHLLMENKKREAEFNEQKEKATNEEEVRMIQARYEEETRRKEELEKMLQRNR